MNRGVSKRSTSTCIPCRARKVRCDGLRDICSNCERLGFKCSYSHVQGLTITERRRARQACLNCHARKSKCGGETPTCERCRRQGVPCVYQATKRSNFSTTSSGTSVAAERRMPDFSTEESPATRPPLPINGDNSSLLPDKTFMLRVFETFFSLIHPLPAYSFLHKSTVILRYHAGLMDEALLLALIGITSAMADLGEGTREYGTRCIDASEAIILKNIARPSVVKVQTLVLIIKHRVQTQQSGSAFMLLALASRMAYALRLNFENNQLCFLAQESRRRVMWSVFILDGGFGAGIGDFLLSPPASIHIQLPCPDRNFELDLSVKTESLESSSSGQDLTDKLGLAAYHIRLANVRCKILQYTKQIVVQHHQSAPPDSIPQHVAALKGELEKFASHLPSRIAFSPNNLRLRAFSPELGSFILIHLWWHQCHLDLYRVGLTGLREALPQSTLERIIDPEFKSLCLQQCFDNSIALYDIFTLLLDLGGIRLPPMDIDLPICAYQCARVIFYLHRKHEVLFNLDYERARTCGQRCLDVIAEQSNQGQFISTIRTDLEDLIQRRPSNRSPSPAVTNPAQGPSSDAERPPLLSRHSVIGSINILDGDESLLMPHGAPNKQQQQQQQQQQHRQAVSNTPSREEEHRPQRRTRYTQTLDIVLGDVRGRTWEDSDAFQGAFDGIEPESDVYGMGLGAWPTEEWSGNQFEFASSTSVPDMSLRW